MTAAQSRLELDLEHRVGDFDLSARFTTAAGITALFGRSGSGKTTLVNLIAGLLRPERGRIALDGRILVDTAQRVVLPAHRREVGYVFQDARLFPHLDVRQNLLYASWFRRSGARPGRFDEVVDLLGLDTLLQRRPRHLSGGEQQRVALGRALLASPRLLLLDEPLAALDVQRRAEILPYIERLRDEVNLPMVYVSHSVGEVARLADNVIVLHAGRVIANGPAAQVLTRGDFPVDADDAGSILAATVVEYEVRYALTRVRAAGGDLFLAQCALAQGSKVHLHVRARDVMLSVGTPPTQLSAQNVLCGQVISLQARGEHAVDVQVDCAGDVLLASVTRRAVDQLALAPGDRVYAIIKSVAIDGAGVGAVRRIGVDSATA